MSTRGRYHVSIDPSVQSVVHIHSKPDPLKEELDRIKKFGYIEKVPLNEQADWVSSLVCFNFTTASKLFI